MAEPDDIEKLLREIDAMNAGAPAGKQVPAAPEPKAVEAAPSSSGGSRLGWAGVSAVGGFFAGGLAGAILPFVQSPSAAVGAAIGAAIVGLVGRPPKWLSGR